LIAGRLKDVNKLYSRKAAEARRVVFYSLFAASGFAAAGYFLQDFKLYVLAGAAGTFIGGFGFLLIWMDSQPRSGHAAPGQPKLFSDPMHWLWVCLAVVHMALMLLEVMGKR
jgi:hypothetical protein